MADLLFSPWKLVVYTQGMVVEGSLVLRVLEELRREKGSPCLTEEASSLKLGHHEGGELDIKRLEVTEGVGRISLPQCGSKWFGIRTS